MTRIIEKLEVSEEVLREAMRLSHKSDPKAAVLYALKNFTRPRSQADLIKFLGTSDGFYTDEELAAQREMDS